MKIRHGMILDNGRGKRMKALTLKTAKPLINIGNRNLLERAIDLLINHGVKEIVINVHHLADQIKNFINDKKYQIKITISDEQKTLLDTGGGVYQGTKIFENSPFLVVNPDTLWNKNYSTELNNLEELYFKTKKSCLLLVNKKLSFDSSFKGDFNLNGNIVTRDNNNQYIFTGLQILNRNVFISTTDKIFSMNKIWDDLINNKNLLGIQSNQQFYHLNTKKTYDKISDLKITD